jgi:hypothetical protein
MTRLFRTAALTTLMALFFMSGASAQGPDDKPVAVMSLVWGEVTIKHTDADYKPARWLEPVYPGDLIRTAGPGSKLLITYFYDNHQEVVGPDMVGTATAQTLTKTEGEGTIRKDPARNPFGAGGVANPFIYTHKLIEDDFKGKDEGIEAEQGTLRARVRPAFPPSFSWEDSGAEQYTLSIFEPAGSLVWSKDVKGTQYKLTQAEGNQLLKGVNYKWGVTADGNEVVRPYEFMLLTLPLRKWFDEQAATFDKKRKLGKLERSDWTDYLLVCSQVNEIDRVFELMEKMKEMDSKNPRLYRALTRVYIYKKCPAHAQAAHDKLVELGGRDPIYP